MGACMSSHAPATPGPEARVFVKRSMESALLPAAERLQSSVDGSSTAVVDGPWKAVMNRVVPCCTLLKGAAPLSRRASKIQWQVHVKCMSSTC